MSTLSIPMDEISTTIDASISAKIVARARIASNFPGSSNEVIPYHEKIRLENFIRSAYPTCQITRIERLCNEQLFAAFKIKQFEMDSPQVVEMIHATGASNVRSIEDNNLDWRRVQRSLYGKGNSFSKNAAYANKYCSLLNGSARAFIICDVLVGSVNVVRKNNYQDYPHNPYDTYLSNTGLVYVKFEDFTFYPKYAIYYST